MQGADCCDSQHAVCREKGQRSVLQQSNVGPRAVDSEVFRNSSSERIALMKTTKLAILIVTIAMALFILIPNLSWADDGASLYKTKCAACHGADGAGKPAAKIPSLTSDEAKKMSDD